MATKSRVMVVAKGETKQAGDKTYESYNVGFENGDSGLAIVLEGEPAPFRIGEECEYTLILRPGQVSLLTKKVPMPAPEAKADNMQQAAPTTNTDRAQGPVAAAHTPQAAAPAQTITAVATPQPTTPPSVARPRGADARETAIIRQSCLTNAVNLYAAMTPEQRGEFNKHNAPVETVKVIARSLEQHILELPLQS